MKRGIILSEKAPVLPCNNINVNSSKKNTFLKLFLYSVENSARLRYKSMLNGRRILSFCNCFDGNSTNNMRKKCLVLLQEKATTTYSAKWHVITLYSSFERLFFGNVLVILR